MCPAADDASEWTSPTAVPVSGNQSLDRREGTGEKFCYRLRACYGDSCGAWSLLFVEVLSLALPENFGCSGT